MLRLSQQVLAIVTALAAALLLSACPGPRRDTPPDTQAPPPLEAVPGARLYEVDPERSLVTIRVYRGGTLAQAGHNHVIASHAVTGRVYLHDQPGKSAFELIMPVETLTVDEPELREAAGKNFPSGVPEPARQGTKGNMLGAALLDGARFPVIRLVSAAVQGPAAHPSVRVKTGVKEHWSEQTIPVALQGDGKTLTATGEFAVRQTDLGLEPFSVMMGALKVQDEMTVTFSILAISGARAR